MTNRNKRSLSKTTATKSKMINNSFSNEFELTPSQTYNLRLIIPNTQSLFTTPKNFSGKACDFLKLLITQNMIVELFTKQQFDILSPSGSFDFFGYGWQFG